MVIDRNCDDPRAGELQRVARTAIARLFEPHRVAGREQRLRGERQRLLGPVDDHDLFGRAHDRAHGPEVRCQDLAQRRQAHGIAVRHLPRRQPPRVSRDESRPKFRGKLVKCGVARAKGAAQPEPRFVGRGESKGRCAPRPRAVRRRGDVAARVRRDLIGQRSRHEAPRTDAALEVPLGQELLEGHDGRNPRDVQVLGQRSRRGQALAGPQATIENGLPIAVVELAMQRPPETAIERDDRTETLRRTFHALHNGPIDMPMFGYF
jgi:hypothetical protein